MILEDLGLSGSNLTVGGSAIWALAWMWRKMNAVEVKVSSLELKMAEQYVTKPELKVLEDKLDRHNEVINTKVDNITNLLIQKNRDY